MKSRYLGSKIPGSQQSLLRETAICILERWKKSMKEQSCIGEYSNNSATIKLYWFFLRLIDFGSSERSDECALIDMAATFARPRFVVRAEQRLRMCIDGRGLGSKLVSVTKGFSKHPNILTIFKVDSEYLRFPFKAKVDYFILYSILVYSFVIFLIFFAMNKRRRTNEASLLN